MLDQKSSLLDDIFLSPDTNIVQPIAALVPTLVIGLGGTGVNSVRSLKNRIRTRLKPAGAQLIELLAVDTVPRQNHVNEEHLTESEYTYLGNYNAAEIIRNLGEHKLIQEWWPATQEQLGTIHNGARQKRFIGRLSLFFQFNAFQQKLQTKIDNLTQLTRKEQAENENYEVLRPFSDTRIYIISSLCGGTGAGTFLDTAIYLRQLYGERAFITGIFTMPSVIERLIQSPLHKARIKANAYASLKELDYVMSSDRFLEVAYPGVPVKKVGRLFNRVYLVEGTDYYDNAVADDKIIYDMIAQQVFIETATPLNNPFWQRENNVSDEVHARTYRKLCFSSFVSTSIHMDIPSIERYAAASITQQLVERHIMGDFKALPKAECNIIDDEINNFIETTNQSLEKQANANQALSELQHLITNWLIQYGYGPALASVQRLVKELEVEQKEFEGKAAKKDKLKDQCLADSKLKEKQSFEIQRPSTAKQVLSKLGGQGAKSSIEIQLEEIEKRKAELKGEALKLAENSKLAETEAKKLRNHAKILGFLAGNFDYLKISVNQFQQTFRDVTHGLDRLKTQLLEEVRTNETLTRNVLNHELCDEKYLREYITRAEERLLPRLYKTFVMASFDGVNKSLKEQRQREYLAPLSRLSEGFVLSFGKEEERASRVSDMLRRMYNIVLRELRSDLEKENVLDVLFSESGEKEDDGLVDTAGPNEKRAFQRKRYSRALREIDQLIKRSYYYVRMAPERGNDDSSFQEIYLIGVANSEDRRLLDLLDYNYSGMKDQLINTGDRTRIEVTFTLNGLSVDHLKVISDYRHYYNEFQKRKEILHLAYGWEEMPDLITESMGDASKIKNLKHFVPINVALSDNEE